MYVDNIVFTLQDLKSSVQTLNQIIMQFGALSGYNINNAKSVLMGVGLRKVDKRRITEALMKARDQCRKKLGLISSPYMPIFEHSDFAKALQIEYFSIWKSLKLTRIFDFLKNHVIKSYEELQHEAGKVPSPFFNIS